MSDDHVYDLGWLEANFRDTRYDVDEPEGRIIVIKMGDYYHEFNVEGECIDNDLICLRNSKDLVPMAAHPHKFVTLKTVQQLLAKIEELDDACCQATMPKEIVTLSTGWVHDRVNELKQLAEAME
jgi:hypothetical protein